MILGGNLAQAVKNASIVICAKTGTIYHQSNPDVITHPASLTKMMTLYLTFKALREHRLNPEQKLTVSKHASNQQPTKLGLKPGTTITVRQAISALAVKSANDAAVAIAEALGNGSETQFARMMTQQARKLGMTNTIFKNASGLPNKQQITTARDMAILSRSLYKDFPEYFGVFKEKQFSYKGQIHRNHNHLLGKVKGVDGIKTGFICASGFNLAASMVRDGRRIIAVVLGGESWQARDKKMVHLLETVHSRLAKNNRALDNENYASIGELIHALGRSESYTSPTPTKKKERIHKAIYLSTKTGKIKTLSKPQSVDDILAAIDDENPYIKKASQKSSSKKKKKKKKRISH